LEKSLQKLTTPEHADSGFITILTTFGYPGLQVEIGGKYQSIEPVKDTLIVNLGETLSKISNGTIKATRHRVLDIGKERFSCPFFLEPKFSAKISSNILQSQR
jgi:isopenicillin N synthase-like dioxygenase